MNQNIVRRDPQFIFLKEEDMLYAIADETDDTLPIFDSINFNNLIKIKKVDSITFQGLKSGQSFHPVSEIENPYKLNWNKIIRLVLNDFNKSHNDSEVKRPLINSLSCIFVIDENNIQYFPSGYSTEISFTNSFGKILTEIGTLLQLGETWLEKLARICLLKPDIRPKFDFVTSLMKYPEFYFPCYHESGNYNNGGIVKTDDAIKLFIDFMAHNKINNSDFIDIYELIQGYKNKRNKIDVITPIPKLLNGSADEIKDLASKGMYLAKIQYLKSIDKKIDEYQVKIPNQYIEEYKNTYKNLLGDPDTIDFEKMFIDSIIKFGIFYQQLYYNSIKGDNKEDYKYFQISEEIFIKGIEQRNSVVCQYCCGRLNHTRFNKTRNQENFKNAKLNYQIVIDKAPKHSKFWNLANYQMALLLKSNRVPKNVYLPYLRNSCKVSTKGRNERLTDDSFYYDSTPYEHINKINKKFLSNVLHVSLTGLQRTD
ncbi:hypothetical protein TVAG_276620 [Trichomonas vaginalis G3]|uniref:Uncharacterized protein n=1 Tax=Trichomonas vaginalis (strain ATCC PRA-98 / G3) TaxID=412133 RepID=A2FFD1_TRIV3|nr:hypothetical protein TVAGG3_0118590 [Trichomonas vaginalis G3]EAX96377.1 hypothetical protein TVAG_276620 [Trichomonas vaginalis G3]KAI5545318.1 hypothetical protein TVAGG3_0118590 [Trichomonas vaginalis G3]|eukprot:XP_001309307.1 hypothetical protein [Trichomonas vaginalis G3]